MSDTPDRQLVHIVCGSTGAGKTTYALRLAKELGGMRFSLDEWMNTLFWMDMPPAMEIAWAFERIDRCTAQILSIVKQLASNGTASVLDLGFVRKLERDRVAAFAAQNGLCMKMHVLDVPADVRWERVRARNAAKGETFHFEVRREAFDTTETLWEPPTEQEMFENNGVRIVVGAQAQH